MMEIIKSHGLEFEIRGWFEKRNMDSNKIESSDGRVVLFYEILNFTVVLFENI
jgi:hypothetical protein